MTLSMLHRLTANRYIHNNLASKIQLNSAQIANEVISRMKSDEADRMIEEYQTAFGGAFPTHHHS